MPRKDCLEVGEITYCNRKFPLVIPTQSATAPDSLNQLRHKIFLFFSVQNPSVYLSDVINTSILQNKSIAALSPPVYTKLIEETL